MEEKTVALAQNAAERNYGIDLLRLVSMFMVVVLHVLGQGGVLANTQPLGLKSEVFWGMEIACYCAANVFAIISGYVGVKAKHKFSNLIALCLQLIFYSVLITAAEIIVVCSTNQPFSWVDVLSYLFPSSTSMWYFSAYFCLFFFMPLLNHIIEHVPRKTLKVTGIFVFIVFCCWTRFFSGVSKLGDGYSVLWLAILYVVGGYMYKYRPFANYSASKSFFAYLLCVGITIVSRILIGHVSLALFGKIDGVNFLVSYTSPTIFFAAVFLVHLFANVRIGGKAKTYIAFASPMSFGVYLIHCHPYLFRLLKNVFAFVPTKPLLLGVLLVLVGAVGIFISCLFIDKLRILLFQACKAKQASIRIENALKKFFTAVLRVFHISLDDEGV